jgi:hypothetical protein
MARRKKPDLGALERDVAQSRRALAETLRALRGRRSAGKAADPAPLDRAGAKPGRSAAGGIPVLGALVGLALVVPRILVKLSRGEEVEVPTRRR